MSWYAIEVIDDAVEDTKELLLPFDLGTWLRLALIVIFTGGGVGFVNPSGLISPDLSGVDDINSSSTASQVPDNSTISTNEIQQNAVTGMATAQPRISNAVLAIIGLSLIGIITLIFYVSSVFEFIYYQSLMDKDVSIRKNFRKHWLNGLQYFAFEFVYLLAIAGLLAALVGGFVLNPVVGIFGLIIGIPALLVLAVFAGLVHDFVLLQMITAEEGLISGWRSIWPDLREQWREVLVYLIVKLGIGIAIGIAVTTLALALLIPFILVFGVFAALLSSVAEVLILIPLITGLLIFGILMLGVTVVTRTFVYFFVIEVYHSLAS